MTMDTNHSIFFPYLDRGDHLHIAKLGIVGHEQNNFLLELIKYALRMGDRSSLAILCKQMNGRLLQRYWCSYARCAIKGDLPEVLDELRMAGLDLNIASAMYSPLNLPITPIVLVAQRNAKGCLEYLLAKGVDEDVVDERGRRFRDIFKEWNEK